MAHMCPLGRQRVGLTQCCDSNWECRRCGVAQAAERGARRWRRMRLGGGMPRFYGRGRRRSWPRSTDPSTKTPSSSRSVSSPRPAPPRPSPLRCPLSLVPASLRSGTCLSRMNRRGSAAGACRPHAVKDARHWRKPLTLLICAAGVDVSELKSCGSPHSGPRVCRASSCRKS